MAVTSYFRFTVQFNVQEDGNVGKIFNLESNNVPEEMVTSILEQLVRYRKEHEFGEFRKAFS